MWQDFVFTAGSIVFILALIPTLRSAEKPPMLTSCLTANILGLFSIVYLTLDLYFSAVVTMVTATCWWVIFYQRHLQIKEQDPFR